MLHLKSFCFIYLQCTSFFTDRSTIYLNSKCYLFLCNIFVSTSFWGGVMFANIMTRSNRWWYFFRLFYKVDKQ